MIPFPRFRHYTLLLLLLMARLTFAAQITSSRGQVFHVNGTELAYQSTLADVLRRLPGITLTDESLTMVGQGDAVIYIDQRRVFDLAELSQLDASLVDSIELLVMPGAVYGSSVEVVLLVSLLNLDDGFHIDEHAHLTAWTNLSWANELALSWQRNKLTLMGFLSFSDKHTDDNYDQFTHGYEDTSPAGEPVSKSHIQARRTFITRQATARATMDYRFSDSHLLSARYEYMCEPDKQVSDDQTLFFYTNPDWENPILKQQIRQTQLNSFSSHTGNLAYTGRVGIATIGSNLDMRYSLQQSGSQAFEVDGEKYVSRNHERFEQFNSNLRIYASLAAWKGGLLTLGSEWNAVWQRNQIRNEMDSLSLQSGLVSNYIFGLYALAEHTWGDFSVKGGLRYEYEQLDYHVDSILASHRPSHSALPQLAFRYQHADWLASLGYQSSVFTPSLKTFHIRNHDFNQEMDVIIGQSIERRHMAILTLGWKWLQAQMTYTYFLNPVFMTINSKVGYNGPNYSALGTQFTLAPVIAWWSPVLTAHIHKQWLDMPLANGQPFKLRDPRFRIDFRNTFSLPLDFTFHLDFSYASPGTEANVRYFSNSYNLQASLQKDFLQHRLSLTLSGTNLLGMDRRDVTVYEPSSLNLSSVGDRVTPDPSISFSIRYRM